MPGVSDTLWSAQDTTPGEIEAALRRMLHERHAESAGYVPARALNLVCVVDKAWSGEVANRLRQVGRYHASRTIVCEVEPKRAHLDAVATIANDVHPKSGEYAVLRETVIVDVGERHLSHLDSIVDPLVVSDLPTVVWSPHGHHEAVAELLGLAQVVLLDSVDEPDLREGLGRAATLLEQAYVVDLAWLRSTPWRERVAATFDPPTMRAQLRQLSALAVRHHPDSTASALLFVGWLASRLNWRLAKLGVRDDGLGGSAHGQHQDIALRVAAEASQAVRGLAGVRLETAAGWYLELDRGAGGLHARSGSRKGPEREWTVLGASRGESGILGEGIRQAFLRDPTYGPALAAANALIP